VKPAMTMLRRSSLAYVDGDLRGFVMVEAEWAVGRVVRVRCVNVVGSCVLRRDVDCLRGEASDERIIFMAAVLMVIVGWWLAGMVASVFCWSGGL
jgi:hypothetical protein